MSTKINRNLSGWSLEQGYSKEFTENEYPARVLESGQKGALELVLTSYTRDYDFMCNTLRKGLKIYLTMQGE